MNDRLRQTLVIVALVSTVIMNALANILPLAGRTTGEISDSFPILFVPAGYVFSIWGLIYLGLGAYAIFQALPAQRENPRLRAIGAWFILSCAFNVAWLVAWHNLAISLSLVFMLGLLFSLIMIYQGLRIGQSEVSRAEAISVRTPFSIYLGWITVATAANASTVLYNLGFESLGLGAAGWAFIVILVATALGLTMLARRADWVYNMVLIWALAGIAVKHWQVPLVGIAAVAAALLIAVAILMQWIRPGMVRQLARQ